jgi:hypothetical protein
METSLKWPCLGTLFLANAKAIQTTCKFKVAKAQEIFELEENTTGTIDINQVCPTKNSIKTRQIKSGDAIN